MSHSQTRNAIYLLVTAIVLLIIAAILDKSSNDSLLVSSITAIFNIVGMILLIVSMYKLVKSKRKDHSWLGVLSFNSIRTFSTWQIIILGIVVGSVAIASFVAGFVNGGIIDAVLAPIINMLIIWVLFILGYKLYKKFRPNSSQIQGTPKNKICIRPVTLRIIAVSWLILGSIFWLIGGLKFSLVVTNNCVKYKPAEQSLLGIPYAYAAINEYLNNNTGTVNNQVVSPPKCVKYEKILYWYPTTNATRDASQFTDYYHWSSDTKIYIVFFVLPFIMLSYFGFLKNKVGWSENQ